METAEELQARLARMGQEEPVIEKPAGQPQQKYDYSKLWEPSTTSMGPLVWMQPEHEPSSDPATFKIGDRDSRYGKRQAIPYWRAPNPGEPMTPELHEQSNAHWATWERGCHYLECCIRYKAYDMRKHNPGLSDYEQLKAERWQWLLGLWCGLTNSFKMTPPSDEQMEAWAREVGGTTPARTPATEEPAPVRTQQPRRVEIRNCPPPPGGWR